MNRRIPNVLSILALLLVALTAMSAYAQTPVPPVANPCQRFAAGSVVHQPPALFSQNGVLNVQFSYQTTTDNQGRQLFCFMTPSGLENPTLHLNPGDTLNITVTNNTPPVNLNNPNASTEPFNPPNCGDTTEQQDIETNTSTPQGYNMSAGSMNIHYHGTNTTPQCHGDNVVKTLINPGSTFQYSVQFPTNEPPGLYWYHPHVHGLAELAVQGGASGALVVDGINNVQPAVAGLRHRVLVIRDLPTLQNMTESAGGTEGGIPQVDLSVNNIPLNAFTDQNGNTSYTPSIIHMESGEQQFWRVTNSTSDVIMDLQVRFDGVAQTIQLVGIDAVPVNSQDGTQPGRLIPVSHFRLPPAARVEFIVNAPGQSVHLAQLVTQNIISGPQGDDAPTRPLMTMVVTGDADNDEPLADDRVATYQYLNTNQQRFGGIMNVPVSVTRTVFFEEIEDGTTFFINASGCVTASGAQCAIQPYPLDTKFDNNNPPAIVTTQGSVEKWIVQNHARENHELHQHQIHFKVLEEDNFAANCPQGQSNCSEQPGVLHQFLDMIEVPFCGGPAPLHPPAPPACVNAQGQPVIPYPQVQLLMDFRGPDIGSFVFHCHILGHEDRGMMAIEQVNPN